MICVVKQLPRVRSADSLSPFPIKIEALDAASLDETKNNYLMSIVSMEEHFGCAIADITTGDCFLTEVDKPQKLLDEINKFVPAEIICNDSFYMSNIDTVHNIVQHVDDLGCNCGQGEL